MPVSREEEVECMLGESWVSSVELYDAIVWWVDSGVNLWIISCPLSIFEGNRLSTFYSLSLSLLQQLKGTMPKRVLCSYGIDVDAAAGWSVVDRHFPAHC